MLVLSYVLRRLLLAVLAVQPHLLTCHPIKEAGHREMKDSEGIVGMI